MPWLFKIQIEIKNVILNYVPVNSSGTRWTFPDQETLVMNENIISLFNNLCYVVVFANGSTMIECIPQAEREVYFAGVRKTPSKLWRNGEYARCWIEWCKEENSAEEKKKSRASCAALLQFLLQAGC